ncbi:hypothetical protein JVT61DRAFT_557 [Boletus reticuloceps]|uniref:Uncharacterized protein n=1 Tax=Boletus reticuloceps TaxID=495285 RepID=A0A8I3AFU3_9AGAM|nr:hypothetical protein JVT61DRAFT_557 [Boletus reticuloceps]
MGYPTDILTYRYNEQLVYVSVASSYNEALSHARNAFPQLEDVHDASLSLSLLAPTSGHAPSCIDISAKTWPKLVAHMSRYQIVDVHVHAQQYRFLPLSVSRPTITSLPLPYREYPPPSLSRPASFPLYVPPPSRSSSSRSATIPVHVSSRPLPPCPVSPASLSISRLSHSFPSRQPLPSSSVPLASLSAPSVPEGTTTSVTSRFQLPAPVTTNDDIVRLKGRINVERSAVPPLITLTAGLAAVSSSQPKAVLLFIGAGTVILGIYFVVPPKDDEKTHPVMSAFLRRLPDVFTAAGCTLIVLGIGAAFPDEVALIPLFSFISFAALALLFGAILAVWVTVASMVLHCVRW